MTFDWNLASSAHDVLLACSACARDSAPGAWLLIAAMLAVPYVVATVVVRAVRRAEGADAAGDQAGRP
jgi:hypothetical protein